MLRYGAYEKEGSQDGNWSCWYGSSNICNSQRRPADVLFRLLELCIVFGMHQWINDSNRLTRNGMGGPDQILGTIWHLPGGSEEHPKLGWRVCQPRFETGTPKIQINNATSSFSSLSSVTWDRTFMFYGKQWFSWLGLLLLALQEGLSLDVLMLLRWLQNSPLWKQ